MSEKSTFSNINIFKFLDFKNFSGNFGQEVAQPAAVVEGDVSEEDEEGTDEDEADMRLDEEDDLLEN